MKKQYNTPKLDVVNLELNDIVTQSNGGEKLGVSETGYTSGATQWGKRRPDIWGEDED